MTIPKSGVRVTLILLFAAAVWIRMHSSGELVYPYYKGASATNYRHASLISAMGSLPAIDDKSSWPEGYPPARVSPNGVEFFTGYAFRVVSKFSDMSLKEFSGRLSILVFSLCVFTFYTLTYKLWLSRGAGLLAAFLVAFSGPLVAVTYGREYLHTPYAILLISLHLSIVAEYLRSRPFVASALSALVAFMLLAVWELADLYLVAFGALVMISAGARASDARGVVTAHLVALIFAGVLLPHLRAERFLLGWPFVFFVVSTGYLVFKSSLPSRIPGWVYVIAGTVVVSLLVKPLAGGGVRIVSTTEYWLYRVRFLFGKPDDPQSLTDAVRFLWTHAHAYPQPYTIFAFFLPFLFLIRPVIVSLRDIRRGRKTGIWPPVVFAVFGAVIFLLDRSAIFAAALALFPLMAVSAYRITRHFRTRAVPIAVASLLVLLQSFSPVGKANATYHLASTVGVSPESTGGFLWVSIGNADLELVRHLVSRTSVRDAIMAPPPISSLVVSFAGRKAVLTPGVFTVDAMARTNSYMSKYYDHEGELFAICDAHDIRYVLYSIDILLDASKYSPGYNAGIAKADERSLAYKMHFEPQNLKHFNLVYENDTYRLFRVTKEMEPVFLTDHPPVYQKTILSQHGGDLQSFYDGIIDILLTYQTAIDAQRGGDDEDAIRRFRYCLEKAPLFTNAWLGAGDSLFRLGDIEAANAAYTRALEAAPDNPKALYNSALTLARLGKRDHAIGLLEVLISSSSDRAMVEEAQELKAAIERDMRPDDS
jgi:hypothetical protein